MMRMVMRLVMGVLVTKGISAVSRGGKDAADMTREERQSAQSKRQNMGRVRQAANMMRRFMR